MVGNCSGRNVGVIMVKLSDKYLVRVNRNSSKGNQLKWKKDDIWYKADNLGYEGLAEYMVSSLLKKTNVADFVEYDLTSIEYNGISFCGCSSKSFLEPNEVLITLPRLFTMYLNEDIYMECERLDRTEVDCIKYVADHVSRITGLTDFGKHLTLLLEMDAFFFNEDRHFHNIAVIYNEETRVFSYCPIFDCGCALFSDTRMYYPLDKSLEECEAKVKAKPFSPSFDDQVNAARSLYGVQFAFWFSEADVDSFLKKAEAKNMYDEQIRNRVGELIKQQINIWK